jgi:solute carrier family 25 (mitochondrial aspartate/glutamate transporter), member 12/13
MNDLELPGDLFPKEIAGHKLSDAVVDRLPTLCTLTPGGKITFSEVNAFHNVIRGELSSNRRDRRRFNSCRRDGYGGEVCISQSE